MKYYRVPIENGEFVGVNYDDIVEGVAFERHVKEGFGFIATEKEYLLEEVEQQLFETERGY